MSWSAASRPSPQPKANPARSRRPGSVSLRFSQHRLEHRAEPLLQALLELARALATDPEALPQLAQGDRLLGQEALLEDEALAGLEGAHQLVELLTDGPLELAVLDLL